MFLQANGYDWLGPDDVEIAERLIAVIERKAELSFFADIFALYVVRSDQFKDPDHVLDIINALTYARKMMEAAHLEEKTKNSQK